MKLVTDQMREDAYFRGWTKGVEYAIAVISSHARMTKKARRRSLLLKVARDLRAVLEQKQ